MLGRLLADPRGESFHKVAYRFSFLVNWSPTRALDQGHTDRLPSTVAKAACPVERITETASDPEQRNRMKTSRPRPSPVLLGPERC